MTAPSLRHRQLTDSDRAAVAELAAAATRHDGVPPLSEEHLIALRDPAVTVATVQVDGVVRALASRSGQAVEVVVHPAHRRRGLGIALVQDELAAARQRGEPALGFWAHGDLLPARALASRCGLQRTRELLVMARALDPDAAAEPDPAFRSLAETGREEREQLLQGWLALNSRAFRDHPEQGRWTRRDLDQRIAEAWFDPELLWLLPRTAAGAVGADEDSAAYDGAAHLPHPAASVWVKPGQDRPEIYVLAVEPDLAGRGLGRRALQHALGELSRRGATEVELYVDGGNQAAVRLYERAGFAVVARHAQYTATQPD